MSSESPYVTSSTQLRNRSPRESVRHLALYGLAGARRMMHPRHDPARNRVHHLYLHHVLPDEEAQFRTLIRSLAAHYTFIGYSESVARVRGVGKIDRPYLAISFDDGLRCCARAARILDEFGVSACFFVNPSIIGETRYPVIRTFSRDRLELPPVEFMSWRELEALRALGHEVGNHTFGHVDLARCSIPEIEEQIGGSFQLLRNRLGDTVHFSWPYGRFTHFSAAAAAAVFKAGAHSCASAERGCHVTAHSGDPAGLCIRREKITATWPLSHVRYFLARSAAGATAKDNGWPAAWIDEIRERISCE